MWKSGILSVTTICNGHSRTSTQISGHIFKLIISVKGSLFGPNLIARRFCISIHTKDLFYWNIHALYVPVHTHSPKIWTLEFMREFCLVMNWWMCPGCQPQTPVFGKKASINTTCWDGFLFYSLKANNWSGNYCGEFLTNEQKEIFQFRSLNALVTLFFQLLAALITSSLFRGFSYLWKQLKDAGNRWQPSHKYFSYIRTHGGGD